MGLKLAAACWGLAEATLFFIVPDVLLSAVALRERKRALMLCLWVLAGALVGGTLMYLWGSRAPETVRSILLWVPAVSDAMLAKVADDLTDTGAVTTFFGPLTGTPYKLYAALAPAADISLLVFLLISIPARMVRFVLVSLLTSWIAQRWLNQLTHKQHMKLLLVFWCVFYAVFFSVFD